MKQKKQQNYVVYLLHILTPKLLQNTFQNMNMEHT